MNNAASPQPYSGYSLRRPVAPAPDQPALQRATRAHYEAFPFIEGGPRRVALWRDRLRRDLPDQLIEGCLVLDVGSGTGEVAHSLTLRGANVVCVDLTQTALRRNQELHPGTAVSQADALALPFPDNTFHHSIAIGVLHHTPDCRGGLSELARVTRPGGKIIVLLYSPWTPYHLAYRATGRLRLRYSANRLNRVSGLPMALLAAIVAVLTHQRLAEDQLRRLLADQFWTPCASFQSIRQVRKWAASLGLEIRRINRIPLYSNIFVIQRPVKLPVPAREGTPGCNERRRARTP